MIVAAGAYGFDGPLDVDEYAALELSWRGRFADADITGVGSNFGAMIQAHQFERITRVDELRCGPVFVQTSGQAATSHDVEHFHADAHRRIRALQHVRAIDDALCRAHDRWGHAKYRGEDVGPSPALVLREVFFRPPDPRLELLGEWRNAAHLTEAANKAHKASRSQRGLEDWLGRASRAKDGELIRAVKAASQNLVAQACHAYTKARWRR